MTSSIRMVPSSQPETMAAGAIAPQRYYRQQDEYGGDLPPQSITVTRTLDIAPASSPHSRRSTSMERVRTRGYVQGADSDSQSLRAVTSMGSLLPNIPKLSAIDLSQPVTTPMTTIQSRPSTAPAPREKVATSAPAPKLPPFMQSRRWARVCEASVRPKIPVLDRAPSEEEERPMTMREASFEQQRAIWKHAHPVVAVDRPDDKSSILTVQGLCRPLSLPTWQLVRTARTTHQTSQSSNSVLRKLGMQRTGTTKHHRRKSVEKTSPRVSRTSQMARKRASSDLRKKANHVHRRQPSRTPIVNLDFDTPPRMPAKRSSSPVPSLHDPEKAKRFSEESRQMLTDGNFENDFMDLAAQPSRTLSNESRRAPESLPSPEPDLVSRLEKTDARAKVSTPEVNNAVAHVPSGSPKLIPPQPPERKSSKGGAKTPVLSSKPTCMPLLSSIKGLGNGTTPDDTSEHFPAQQALVVPQPSRAPLRMISNASTARTVSDSTKRPRGAMSTDTLMMIEAQIQSVPQTSLVARLKQKAGFAVKKMGPAGMPPERPLPELPACSPVDQSQEATLPSPKYYNAVLAQPSARTEQNAIDNKDSAGQIVSGRAAGVAAGKGLTVESTDPKLEDSALPSASSAYSRRSSFMPELSSKPRFSRHDISQFRADRIRDLKRRIKADMSRERRISEEGEDTDGSVREIIKVYKDLDPPLPPLPALREQSSLDSLDKFPPVPVSRPASRASHNSGSPLKRTGSRKHSHARQSSKASSRYSYHPSVPRIPQRQVLGTSQIKVLVDTNPVTGRFRAGVMTPEPSSLDSRESSPIKHSLRSTRSAQLPTRIDENGEALSTTSPLPRKKTSLQSMRAQTPRQRRPQMDVTSYAPLQSVAPSPYSTSDDEATQALLASTSKSRTKKLRRRWNSNDIRTVQLLYDDLESYYDTLMAQERELQRQREEIHMMVRVMAPISRARGVRGPLFPGEQHQQHQHQHQTSTDTASLRSNDRAIEIDRLYSPSEVASLNSSPSRSLRTTNNSPVKTNTTTTNVKHQQHLQHKSTTSKANLDAASRALDAVIRDRPLSNISTSSGSATTATASTTTGGRGTRTTTTGGGGGFCSSGSETGAGTRNSNPGSMTDPREYDLPDNSKLSSLVGAATEARRMSYDEDERGVDDGDAAPAPTIGASRGHVKMLSEAAAAAAAAAAGGGVGGEDMGRPKSRGTLSLRSFGRKKSKKMEKVMAKASPAVPMHRAPPLVERWAGGALSSEDEEAAEAEALLMGGGGFLTPRVGNGGGGGGARGSGGLKARAMLGGEEAVRMGLGLGAGEAGSSEVEVGGGMVLGEVDTEVEETGASRLSVHHAFGRTEAWDRLLDTA